MKFKRRMAILLAACGVALGTCKNSIAATRQPNILFVLIDDMGYADLTCYGEHRVHTDQVDRMAAEGIRFTQFYVNSPICSPSRTGLMTGQHPARWKITSYLDNRAMNTERGMAQWLDPSAPTVAREFHSAGYATGHFGKWHMGGQRDVADAPLITEYGFDKSLTNFEGLGDRLLPLLNAYDGTPPKKYALGSDKLGHGNITWMDRSKITSGYVDGAIKFIKQAEQDNKPFYVDVWPDDVHSPFFPPQALRGDATKKQLYLGVVQATDDQLKPLFDLVRQDPKLRDNTLVVIASDNGPEPGAGSPGIFRGHKGNLYEGGIREPFITWGPGLLDPKSIGSVNDQTVVAGYDLLPTFLSLANRPLPSDKTFDGVDMTAAVLGKSQVHRTQSIQWIRPPDRPGPVGDPWPDLAIRENDWKLLMFADGSAAQLYDLSKDPSEKTDLAAANPEVVKTMKTALLKWYQTLPVTVPTRATAEAKPEYLWSDAG